LIAIVDNLLILSSFIEVREEAFPIQLKSEKTTKKPDKKGSIERMFGNAFIINMLAVR